MCNEFWVGQIGQIFIVGEMGIPIVDCDHAKNICTIWLSNIAMENHHF
jgi:hypothetical protein